MPKDKTYDLVKDLLEKNKSFRDSDKPLIWEVMTITGHVVDGKLSREAFLMADCPVMETIRRSRQDIQKRFPHLRASEGIQKKRKEIEKTQGTFIYRDLLSGIGEQV